MPPYSGPSKERESYDARFIRVEDKLYVSDPDEFVDHKALAKGDCILEEITRLKVANPLEVDGGYLGVENGIKFIAVSGGSSSLGIPLERTRKEAREKTVIVFQRFSPGYKIAT